MTIESSIIIPREEYVELCRKSFWLDCLEAAGVDNWEGYEVAIEIKLEQLKNARG